MDLLGRDQSPDFNINIWNLKYSYFCNYKILLKSMWLWKKIVAETSLFYCCRRNDLLSLHKIHLQCLWFATMYVALQIECMFCWIKILSLDIWLLFHNVGITWWLIMSELNMDWKNVGELCFFEPFGGLMYLPLYILRQFILHLKSDYNVLILSFWRIMHAFEWLRSNLCLTLVWLFWVLYGWLFVFFIF